MMHSLLSAVNAHHSLDNSSRREACVTNASREWEAQKHSAGICSASIMYDQMMFLLHQKQRKVSPSKYLSSHVSSTHKGTKFSRRIYSSKDHQHMSSGLRCQLTMPEGCGWEGGVHSTPNKAAQK